MIVTNKRTGKDISDLYFKRLKGELSMEEFEKAAGFTPEDRQFIPKEN